MNTLATINQSKKNSDTEENIIEAFILRNSSGESVVRARVMKQLWALQIVFLAIEWAVPYDACQNFVDKILHHKAFVW